MLKTDAGSWSGGDSHYTLMQPLSNHALPATAPGSKALRMVKPVAASRDATGQPPRHTPALSPVPGKMPANPEALVRQYARQHSWQTAASLQYQRAINAYQALAGAQEKASLSGLLGVDEYA